MTVRPLSECHATFSRYSALRSDFKLKLGEGIESERERREEESPEAERAPAEQE